MGKGRAIVRYHCYSSYRDPAGVGADQANEPVGTSTLRRVGAPRIQHMPSSRLHPRCAACNQCFDTKSNAAGANLELLPSIKPASIENAAPATHHASFDTLTLLPVMLQQHSRLLG